MPDVPAVCPNGHQYPSGFFLGDGVTNVTFVGNLSRCPVCRLMGRVEEGTFSVRGGILTRTTVATMAAAVNALSDTEIAELRALLERSAHDPDLGAELAGRAGPLRRLGEILNSPTSIALATWAAVLVAIVLWVLERRQGSGSPGQFTPEQIDQLIDALTQM